MSNPSEMKHIMQRVFRDDFEALRAAEAGMLADAQLVTLTPVEPQKLEFGRTRVYWRVIDEAHIDRVDKAISKELYPDEQDEEGDDVEAEK
jgi:hypothetical protein